MNDKPKPWGRRLLAAGIFCLITALLLFCFTDTRAIPVFFILSILLNTAGVYLLTGPRT